MSVTEPMTNDVQGVGPQYVGGQPPYRGRGLPPGAMTGVVLIVVGTLFLLDHMEVIHIGNFWKFWPMILIVVGISRFFSDRDRTGAILTILVGAYFQLYHLGVLQFSWNTFWPVLLIVAGILTIAKHFDMGGHLRGNVGTQSRNDMLNEFALFGGVERRITINNFRGGRVEAIFGGVEVDLRGAEIEGEEAIIDVEAMFGGIELTVPDRWIVVFQGQSIFGGYGDETRQPVPDVLGNTPRKTLILRGRALFGGIVVKN